MKRLVRSLLGIACGAALFGLGIPAANADAGVAVVQGSAATTALFVPAPVGPSAHTDLTDHCASDGVPTSSTVGSWSFNTSGPVGSFSGCGRLYGIAGVTPIAACGASHGEGAGTLTTVGASGSTAHFIPDLAWTLSVGSVFVVTGSSAGHTTGLALVRVSPQPDATVCLPGAAGAQNFSVDAVAALA